MIQQRLFDQYPPAERQELLEAHAEKVEYGAYYTKQLTEEELLARKDQYAKNGIQLGELKEELALVNESYKGKIKPIVEANTIVLGEIRTKTRSMNGTLYSVAYQEEGVMCTYDEEGDLISKRPLQPHERQLRIGLEKAE